MEGIDFVARFTSISRGRAACPERERLLREELWRHGLRLRGDSQFCKNYIEGDTSASLQEVVATMKMTSKLFGHGHRCFSANHEVLKARMRKFMQERKYSCLVSGM